MPTLNTETRRARAEQRKVQILAAATRVFARKGYERATIAEIAHAAGVAEGSIYNYFRNKADLLVSIPGQFVLPAVQPLRDAFNGEPALAEPLLRLLADNMVTAVTHNSDVVRVILSSLPTMEAPARRKYLEQTPLFVMRMLEKYFRGQIEAGIFNPRLDPAVAARAFPGMLLGILIAQDVFQVGSPGRFAYETVVPQVVDIFLHGAFARGPQPRSRAAMHHFRPVHGAGRAAGGSKRKRP
jgi:TetR/AcrR family transcriptional regulator, fatty acid metabolism regulator protein